MIRAGTLPCCCFNRSITAPTFAGRTIEDNSCDYDKVTSILELKNTAPVPFSNMMGRAFECHYSYDDLCWLTQNADSLTGPNQKQRYQLNWQQGRAYGKSFK